jgi:hypothetical protein
MKIFLLSNKINENFVNDEIFLIEIILTEY